MPLFQSSVIKNFDRALDNSAIQAGWQRFQKHFADAAKQENIRKAKEEQYQEGFLRELFVEVLGYTLNPQPGYDLITEQKNEKDGKKADGALLKGGAVRGVIELKGTDTTDLGKIEKQAFGYLTSHKECVYVVISNFEKLRFYVQNATEHEEFNLFTLTEERFRLLWLLLQKDQISQDVPLKLKEQSVAQEDKVTRKLYTDYSAFKKALYADIVERNNGHDKVELYRKTQKLLDRFLFVLFAEDRGLLPPNSVRQILDYWTKKKEEDDYVPLYERFRKLFAWIDEGNKTKNIFAYNGGLFQPDPVLDTIVIDDELLHRHSTVLSNYDFESEVDVNILGHIFEHSLNDIEQVQAEAEGTDADRSKGRRKKEGVFYTPRYITRYIVENTVGTLCTEKKAALGIVEEEYAPQQKKKDEKVLLKRLVDYRDWLLAITILDPACGSGAFLNAALEFLINEHGYIDELTQKLKPGELGLRWTPNDILEKNLYGVDINEEATEIARLSLWLRTASRERKLSNLSGKIKCGNSLIDDPEVAGDKAFKWEEEFPEVFAKGGFDVVIGNPPYGAELVGKTFLAETYSFTKFDSFELFIEKSSRITSRGGLVGLIIPNSWMTHKAGKELRSFLFGKSIKEVVNFKNKVFEDANIDTLILVFANVASNENFIKAKDVYDTADLGIAENYNSIAQKDLAELDKINCSLSNEVISIFKKIKSNSSAISEKFTVLGGYKPYQIGYGRSAQGDFAQIASDIINRVYHSDVKIDESYQPDIKGMNIGRYSISSNTQWVKWGPWLMSPKKFEYFTSPKIVIREIAGKSLYASYDDSGYFTNDTTHMILDSGNLTQMKSLLAVINSRLIGWYFKTAYAEDSDLFPKVKINEIKDLPLNHGYSSSILEMLVDKMLTMTREIQNLKGSFALYLSSKLGVKLNKKLREWQSLTQTGFLAELSKQKIKLSLEQEEEWGNFFRGKLIKATELGTAIDRTDKEIDRMVYALYGLTEEEIAIVEGAV